MNNYGDRLRRERRSELAMKALPSEVFNKYGEVFAEAIESGDKSFNIDLEGRVPNPGLPPEHVKDMTKVAMELMDLSQFVIDKHFTSGDNKTMHKTVYSTGPSLTACGDDHGSNLKLSVKADGRSVDPAAEIHRAVGSLVQAAKVTYEDYNIKCDVEIKVGEDNRELFVDVEGTSHTPSDVISSTYDSLVTAATEAYGKAFSLEVYIKAKYNHNDETVAAQPSYYGANGVEELATLPPALKAQLVKKLEAKLVAEKDPEKKAEIQSKIDSYQ